MKPIGPLMWEHRLIEKLLRSFAGEIGKIDAMVPVDTVFIDRVVDFIRTYADRTHHGKEEDILFRELAAKELTDNHRHIMNELIEEHRYARTVVGQLIAAKERYLAGDDSAHEISTRLAELAQFYPHHIEKEDKHFFYPILAYFSDAEQERMLAEFYEFDRKMIHERYGKLADEIISSAGKIEKMD
ncbi:MAG: hemerythrin domain-containing protein [Smithellaceae bacterium]|nr:hemerythrin domain-containing protein [Smithellaceae bacterium]